MKWVLRIAVLLVLAPVALFGSLQLASESGEVVVVTTTNSDGAPVVTRLWVIDYEGHQYLRSLSPTAGWYLRLLAAPQVNVVRAGMGADYNAVPAPDKVEAINRLTAEKYGWADAYIGTILGRDEAVAVRLEPVASE